VCALQWLSEEEIAIRLAYANALWRFDKLLDNGSLHILLISCPGMVGQIARILQSSRNLFSLFLLYRLWSRSKECLRHDRRVMVTNLPLPILPHIHKRVPSLNLITGCAHSKLINSCILAPVMSDRNTGLQDLTLGLLLQETNEVMVDQVIASSGYVRDSGEENSILGITFGDRIRIFCCQGRVPELE
jgi:hypothetical protein